MTFIQTVLVAVLFKLYVLEVTSLKIKLIIQGTINGDKYEERWNENHIELPNLTEEVLQKLNPSSRGGKLICIVGRRADMRTTRLDEAQIFAQGLLKMNYNRVCTLHKGIDAFRALSGTGDDVLVVPDI